MFNVENGDPFHDVRPLVYSIAPWLSAVTNLGVRRMPFGIAVRGTNYLEKIESYVYKKGKLNISFSGEGKLNKIIVNGEPLSYTLQIPENIIVEGTNNIQLELSNNNIKNQTDLLVSSTIQLDAIISNNNSQIYKIEAYGKNVLTFKNLDKKIILTDNAGNNIPFHTQKIDNLTYIEFEGRGKYEVKM